MAKITRKQANMAYPIQDVAKAILKRGALFAMITPREIAEAANALYKT